MRKRDKDDEDNEEEIGSRTIFIKRGVIPTKSTNQHTNQSKRSFSTLITSASSDGVDMGGERQDAGALPNIPTITSGWNDLPWNPAPGNSNRLWRLDTNDYENTVSNLIKLLANRSANGATGLHATHLAIDNMNEWAEGHFVGPHRQYGFSRYDAIRSVLAPSAMMNEWLLPEDVGLPWDKFTSCFNEFNVTPCLEKGE